MRFVSAGTPSRVAYVGIAVKAGTRDELDSESGHTGEVEVPFDRERMAEYLGVTRPSLSRALGHLRDQGLITWRKNVFRLKRAQST